MGAGKPTGARWALNGIVLVALLLTGCGIGRPVTMGPETDPAAVPPTQARPLVMFTGKEPASVATRALLESGISLRSTQRMFNALPALLDAQGLPRPELLVSLPALHTDSWQVFPDGTMRTTYTLRSNLTWHDGQPLTSEDFVFSWRLYTSPELGRASQPPLHAISDVAAIDREHFVIHWKLPYADADTLSKYGIELPALPRHILGPVFDQMTTSGADAVANHPFWGPEYVGLGPFRIQEWAAGSFVDAVRFDGYALGAPKIARIQLRFSVDQNTVVASLLAGEAQAAGEGALPDVPEALTERWTRSNTGFVLQFPRSLRYTEFQHRPEVATPRAILDPRVRKAVAHAVDKQAMSDAVYGGQAIFADTPVWSGSAWGDALDDSILTYPLDLRATESLMNQAGYSKGSDGFYRGADGRISLEVATVTSPASVTELIVLADSLRAAGLDVQQRVVPAAQAQDNQVRATHPTMFTSTTNSGEPAVGNLASAQIPSAATRWLGGNRGGWSSSDYDRLLGAFNTTLDRGDRVRLMRQMLRLYSEELPSISLFFRGSAFAFVNEIKGPARAAPESNPAWNIYEWEFY